MSASPNEVSFELIKKVNFLSFLFGEALARIRKKRARDNASQAGHKKAPQTVGPILREDFQKEF